MTIAWTTIGGNIYYARHQRRHQHEPFSAITYLVDYFSKLNTNKQKKIKNIYTTDFDTITMDQGYIKMVLKKEVNIEQNNPSDDINIKKSTEDEFNKLVQNNKLAQNKKIDAGEEARQCERPNPDIFIQTLNKKYLVQNMNKPFVQLVYMLAAYSMQLLVVHPTNTQDITAGCVCSILTDAQGSILAWGAKTGGMAKIQNNFAYSHGETNLVRAYYTNKQEALPNDGYLFTNLQPCRMCASVIAQATQGTINVRYLIPDQTTTAGRARKWSDNRIFRPNPRARYLEKKCVLDPLATSNPQAISQRVQRFNTQLTQCQQRIDEPDTSTRAKKRLQQKKIKIFSKREKLVQKQYPFPEPVKKRIQDISARRDEEIIQSYDQSLVYTKEQIQDILARMQQSDPQTNQNKLNELRDMQQTIQANQTQYVDQARQTREESGINNDLFVSPINQKDGTVARMGKSGAGFAIQNDEYPVEFPRTLVALAEIVQEKILSGCDKDETAAVYNVIVFLEQLRQKPYVAVDAAAAADKAAAQAAAKTYADAAKAVGKAAAAKAAGTHADAAKADADAAKAFANAKTAAADAKAAADAADAADAAFAATQRYNPLVEEISTRLKNAVDTAFQKGISTIVREGENPTYTITPPHQQPNDKSKRGGA